jgi:hypothetical protein
MRIGLASGSVVEAVVTLAAAAMMTFAALAMFEDGVAADAHATTVAACVSPPPSG